MRCLQGVFLKRKGGGSILGRLGNVLDEPLPERPVHDSHPTDPAPASTDGLEIPDREAPSPVQTMKGKH